MSGPVHSERQDSAALAKTTRPRLPRIIVRERCLATLRDAEDSKIVYISGRAGQGKTTLALSWLQETRIKAVWLTLDEGDNDPAGFFRLIAGGFADAFPRNAFFPIPIPTGAPFEPTTFARTYFTTLFNLVSSRYILVLDDFHSLSADGPLYPIVEALVEALPPKVQIAILSRCAPPGFMAKWIAARQLFHFPEEALRFSVGEVRALFKDVLDVPMTRRQAEALHKRTEGWVTGLILLQEQVRRISGSAGPDPIGPRTPARTPDGHPVDCIDDYVYHEIYRRLDPPIRDLMVRTSLFDAFSLASACGVAKHPDVKGQLRCVVDRHLLSEIPEGDTVRYRYHPLLRQFLQARVRDLPDGERLALIEWIGTTLQAEGKVDRAIDLYLAHGQDDRAIHLIEKVGLAYIGEGRRMKLCQWVRSLPPAHVGRRPWLLYFLAAAQEFTAPPAAEEIYHRALEGFEAGGDTEGQIWTLSSLILLRWHAGPDYRPLEGYAKRGRELLRLSEDSCSPVARATFLLAEAISAMYAAGHLQRGLRKALDAAESARRSGTTPLYVLALVYGGRFAVYAGKLQLSSVLFAQAEAAISWKTLDPALRAQALCYRGVAESFRGEAAKSLASMIEAERVCLDYGLASLLPLAQANLARQRVVTRERSDESVSGPVSIEPSRRRISRDGNGYYASFLAYSEALHALREGQLSRALTCAEESIRLMQGCRSPLMVHVPRYLLGAILGEMGETEHAERHLVTVLGGFEKAGAALFAFWTLLHLAKLSLDRGDGKSARTRLAAALRLGKTEGYTEGDGLNPRMMSLLLNRARQWGLEPDYVGTLMAHWNVAPLASLKMYTLGRFEVELHGRSLPDEAWRGRRLKQLLAALITCGGRQVPKEDIIDLLWPEADGARAVTSFHTTLHRLQAVLGHPSANGAGFIRVEGGLVSLDPAQCWSDCCAFEEAVRRAKRFETSGRKSEAQRALHEAGDLYRGEYLPAFRHEAWTEERRQALRRQFLWVEQRLNTTE